MNCVQSYGINNHQSYNNRNLGFRAKIAEPLKKELLTELTPAKGHRILSSFERKLSNVAGDTIIKSISIPDGKAVIELSIDGKIIPCETDINTNGKTDVINKLLGKNKNVTLLEELLAFWGSP